MTLDYSVETEMITDPVELLFMHHELRKNPTSPSRFEKLDKAIELHFDYIVNGVMIHYPSFIPNKRDIAKAALNEAIYQWTPRHFKIDVRKKHIKAFEEICLDCIDRKFQSETPDSRVADLIAAMSTQSSDLTKDPYRIVAGKLVKERLNGYVRSLPQDEKSVIIGLYYSNKDNKQVAAELGTTVDNVNRLENYAMKTLRLMYKTNFIAKSH